MDPQAKASEAATGPEKAKEKFASGHRESREYDIHLSPEQLQVEVEGRTTRISVDYTVRVELPLYPVDLHFTPGHETKVIKGL